MRNRAAIVAGCIVVAFASASHGQIHSKLWGKSGETWQPDGRLPDFSFAGYHFGEDPLPKLRATANVKTFGARGDGKTDDTDAFKKAIELTREGAILIPAGRYVLKDILWIKKPNLVLRGAGTDKTVLLFQGCLEDVRPNMSKTTSGRPTSGYSWSGGFVWVKGYTRCSKIADIVSETKRGGKTLTLSRSGGVKVGQRVRVSIRDDGSKSLLKHLYSGDPGDTKKITRPVGVRFVSRIASVRGSRITLERPLRWDIRKAWKPVLESYTPSIYDVGIEDLAFSFPVKPYKGHFTERGMNAIAMNGVSDCWIRNVKITNCDSGIFAGGMFCTLDRVVIDGKRPASRGDTGHHGITLGSDCLLQNFEFRTKFIHDLTLTNLQSGNVMKNGKGPKLSFDHHKRCPFENLICNVDVGDGAQIWRCGGGRSLGKHCGARGTFWCIRTSKNLNWPHANFGPSSMNIVGMKTGAKSITDPNGKWFEVIPPGKLQPADLHAAQLEKRLKGRRRR